jgi:hypothetical protein
VDKQHRYDTVDIDLQTQNVGQGQGDLPAVLRCVLVSIFSNGPDLAEDTFQLFALEDELNDLSKFPVGG